MLLSDSVFRKITRRSLILSALALASCGFTPVYQKGQGPSHLQNRVQFADPSDRNGFDFVGQMETRLGRAEAAGFTLEYEIETQSNALAITSSQEINRYNLTGSVSYTLKDMDDQTVTAGQVESFTSYSAAGTTVATLTGERDASTRLMTILADKVVTRLLAITPAAP